MNGWEVIVVHVLTSLLMAVVSGLLAYFTPRLKRAIDSHVNKSQAQVVNYVLNGLQSIATSVVQDFNQRVVHDAKAQGGWNPQLAQTVKADAVAAVKDQGSALISLSQGTLTNVDKLISAMIEQTIAQHKASTPSDSTVIQQTSPQTVNSSSSSAKSAT